MEVNINLKFLLIISTILFSSLFLVSQNVYAIDYYWTGGGGTNTDWDVPVNWTCPDPDTFEPMPCPAPGYPQTFFENPGGDPDFLNILTDEDLGITTENLVVNINIPVFFEPMTGGTIGEGAVITNNAQLTFQGIDNNNRATIEVSESTFTNNNLINSAGHIMVSDSSFTNNGGIFNAAFGNFDFTGNNENTLMNSVTGGIVNDGGFVNGDSQTIQNFGSIITTGSFENYWVILNECGSQFEGPVTGNQPIDNCVSNTPPTANDDSYSTDEGTALNVPAPGVLGNDTDPENDPLTAVKDDDPSHGTLSLNSDGGFTYTPDPGYDGDDTFTYHANDGTENSNTATVTITINPANEPPTFTSTPLLEVNEEESYSYSITSSDPNGDSLVVTSNNPLPSWLTLTDAGDGSGSAILEGTPTWDDVGEHEISLQVTEQNTMPPLSDIQEFTITVQGVVTPELQDNLNEKMIKQFEKKIYNWTERIEKLEKRIVNLEKRADIAEGKGKLEKAAELRAKAADKQDKIEILEDMISVVEMSLGKEPIIPIPVELQDNLLPKSVDKIEYKIEKWMHKIAKLNYRADNLEEKAQHFLEKGKEEKAQRLLDRAAALRDKADVFEDLNKVLITAIDFEKSSVKLHHKYDDKEDKEDKDHSWSD